MSFGKRVVITGIGAISPVGNSVAESWDSILNCRSGISRVTRFPVDDYRSQIAGEIKGFNVLDYIDVKNANHLDPFCHYAIAASDEAMKQAGLKDSTAFNPERAAILVSSGVGGVGTTAEQEDLILSKGPLRLSPFCVPKLIANMGAGCLAIRYNFKGPNFGIVSACASGLHAIGEAYWLIQRDDADIVLTGGAEAPIVPISLAGFGCMRALSSRNDDPTHASRPFDKDRDGFVLAEGAASLVLEEYEHARARGAQMLGEVIGYGCTADAHHMTAPEPEGRGLARAISLALQRAELNPEDVDYINAHGTSTTMNDVVETKAIKLALGQRAYEIPVSSCKGVTGHMLGATGAFEAIACLQALNTGIVPPTANLQEPDPECDLNYVPQAPQERQTRVALKLSLGFGGHNAAVLLRKM